MSSGAGPERTISDARKAGFDQVARQILGDPVASKSLSKTVGDPVLRIPLDADLLRMIKGAQLGRSLPSEVEDGLRCGVEILLRAHDWPQVSFGASLSAGRKVSVVALAPFWDSGIRKRGVIGKALEMNLPGGWWLARREVFHFGLNRLRQIIEGRYLGDRAPNWFKKISWLMAVALVSRPVIPGDKLWFDYQGEIAEAINCGGVLRNFAVERLGRLGNTPT